jgi:hypothetical protein
MLEKVLIIEDYAERKLCRTNQSTDVLRFGDWGLGAKREGSGA